MPRPVSNPPNPWASSHIQWLEPPPPARLEVFEEQAKSLLTRNDSPDVPFAWGANPFGARMRGHGPRFEATRRLFEITARRLGMETSDELELFYSPRSRDRGRCSTRNSPPLMPAGVRATGAGFRLTRDAALQFLQGHEQ